MGYYSTFVVRIWVDNDQRMRRGYVQHVATQEAAHFVTFDKMEEFVLSHLSPPQDKTCDEEENGSDMPGKATGIANE